MKERVVQRAYKTKKNSGSVKPKLVDEINQIVSVSRKKLEFLSNFPTKNIYMENIHDLMRQNTRH